MLVSNLTLIFFWYCVGGMLTWYVWIMFWLSIMWSACLNLNTNCFFVELGIKVISTFNFALKLPSIHEITVMVYMWNVMSQNFTIISTRYHLLWKRRMTKRHFHFTNDLFCKLSLWCYRNFWEHREENVLIERVFGKERSLQRWKNAMSKPM